MRCGTERCDRAQLAVFAVEQIAHGVAAGGGLLTAGALLAEVACLFFRFRLTARGAAVGKAGFAWTEFELLTADGAGFDGEGHRNMVAKLGWRVEAARLYGAKPVRRYRSETPN